MDDIHQLIKEGRLEQIKSLVSRDKTSVNALEGGWTPLGVSCQLGSVEICKVLINNGAELNKPVNGSWTPLYIACMEGHVDVVELLLKSGADVKKCDDDLDSPLHIACMCGHFEIAKQLVDGGAIVDALNKEGRSAMEFIKDDSLIAELRKASVGYIDGYIYVMYCYGVCEYIDMDESDVLLWDKAALPLDTARSDPRRRTEHFRRPACPRDQYCCRSRE